MGTSETTFNGKNGYALSVHTLQMVSSKYLSKYASLHFTQILDLKSRKFFCYRCLGQLIASYSVC